MPDQTFGGDDDESLPPEEIKKPKLDKYGLAPDANIRDVFWGIMGSYAATKKPGRELSELNNDRFALIRVAATVLDNPQSEHYGLSPSFVARYSLMMLLDAGWADALSEFMQDCRESRGKADTHLLTAFRYVWKEERYQAPLSGNFREMLRSRHGAPIALHYLAKLKNRQLSEALKRELIILARGDVGENQINAIMSASLLLDDEGVRKSITVLLAHWDVDVRMLAAELLLREKGKPDVKSAVNKRMTIEQNDEVKKALSKILK